MVFTMSYKPKMDFTAAPVEIDEDLEIRFLLYTVCGLIVLISSGLTFVVFTLTKNFRTKYALFNALAVADFINGLSFVVAGVFRSRYMRQGTYFVPTTNSQCIWETPWSVLMIVAGQLPAFFNFCLSMERVIALEFSSWYRRVWDESYKHYLVLVCFGMAAKPTQCERKRQLLLQWITGISVVLVSIPNIVLILNEWNFPKMNPLIVGITYCLYALHSALSLPTYLYFRRDFRQRFVWIFLRRKISCEDSSVLKITPSITVTGPKGQTVTLRTEISIVSR